MYDREEGFIYVLGHFTFKEQVLCSRSRSLSTWKKSDVAWMRSVGTYMSIVTILDSKAECHAVFCRQNGISLAQSRTA
jgi:hypothetical protein